VITTRTSRLSTLVVIASDRGWVISQCGREGFKMNVFDDLGDDTLETKLAAAKIVYDVGRCSAESQESLYTVQRQHNTRWHDTVLAIWRCIFHLNNLSNLRKTLKALFVPLLKFRAQVCSFTQLHASCFQAPHTQPRYEGLDPGNRIQACLY
jgi:hypothetical protein